MCNENRVAYTARANEKRVNYTARANEERVAYPARANEERTAYTARANERTKIRVQYKPHASSIRQLDRNAHVTRRKTMFDRNYLSQKHFDRYDNFTL